MPRMTLPPPPALPFTVMTDVGTADFATLADALAYIARLKSFGVVAALAA